MNSAQRFVVVLALPVLVFIPFYWHTGCLLGHWHCEETRPFLMTLAGLAVLITSGLILRFDFNRLRRRPMGGRIVLALPLVVPAMMVVFLDLHGGSDFFRDMRLPFWWVVLAFVAAVELWLLAGRKRDGTVIEGEFSNADGGPMSRRKP